MDSDDWGLQLSSASTSAAIKRLLLVIEITIPKSNVRKKGSFFEARALLVTSATL
jgi:hypothetical protein